MFLKIYPKIKGRQLQKISMQYLANTITKIMILKLCLEGQVLQELILSNPPFRRRKVLVREVCPKEENSHLKRMMIWKDKCILQFNQTPVSSKVKIARLLKEMTILLPSKSSVPKKHRDSKMMKETLGSVI